MDALRARFPAGPALQEVSVTYADRRSRELRSSLRRISRVARNFSPVRLAAAFPLAGLLVLVSGDALLAQALDFDAEPISYASRPAADPVARLNHRLEKGEVTLRHEPGQGYLRSVLEALDISLSSQVLVFSKTSFQRDLIAPETPRALYFNDDTYIGWVKYGEVMEVASVDPEQGTQFYTLDQSPTQPPRFQRRQAECLQCHASSLTKGVPGPLIRSVYTDRSGQPVLKAGTFLTDHSSPLRERWGGWYVSGTHGSDRHLGNSFLADRSGDPGAFDFLPGANLTDLRTRFGTESYATAHSDLVALLVLEHQSQLHNLVTAANYQARLALRDDAAIRQMMNEPPGPPSDSTLRRFEYAAKPLLRYLLLVDEAPLREPVRGTSGFAEDFQKRGPRDSRGRSLRDLDLATRIFRYPLSPLVYSESLDRFPSEFREHFFRRLHEILTGKDTSKDFARLTPEERTACLEILRETRKGLPESWGTLERPKARL